MARRRIKAPRQVNRRTVSRLQREAMLRRWLLSGAAALFVLIVALLGWGAYAEYVAKPRRPVAVVHGDTIRLDEYQRAVRFRRYTADIFLNNLQNQRAQFAAAEGQESLVQFIDQEIQRAQNELLTLPQTALEELIEDRITRQEAARRGITVTEEEVQLELERQFEYDRNPVAAEPVELGEGDAITETLTPTPEPMTQEQFLESFASYLQAIQRAAGFSEQDFRQMLESSLYRSKLEDALVANAPTTAEQVRALHILVQTEEEAEQALARLAAGEEFEALATELSLDTSSGQLGGDLGWFARGWMVEPFEEAAFSLAPGETSGPVASQFGYHVIRVLERDAARPLEPADVERYHQTLLDEWYLEQRSAAGIEVYWDASMAP